MMIELSDNPLPNDPRCIQISCWFKQDRYSDDLPQQLGIPLPEKLARAVPKRKAEFLAGRYCAQQALSQFGQARDDAIAVKPITTAFANGNIPIGDNREPLWPTGIVGSITHSNGFASVSLASSADVRSIGIDSEFLINEKTAAGVSSHILLEDEQYSRHQDVFESDRHYLTMVFSAKESIFKCLYPLVQTFFGFHAARIYVDKSQPGLFTYQLLQTLNDEFNERFRGEGQYIFSGDFVHTAIVLPR